MVALWCIIGLILSAVSVSILGAAFSVVGLAALFSGAAFAVMLMAGALELSKFVLAAYLHQRWQSLNIFFKTYLVSSVVILSAITSLGIFGFLSDAYQSASTALTAEAIKVNSLKTQQASARAEIDRLNRAVDEIPATRVSKRIETRKEIEPAVAALTKQIENYQIQITQSDLHVIELNKKVGPLVYIAKVFNIEIDLVVKYLIMLFVSVFDPLAICLVIATSEALDSRKRGGKPKDESESEPVSTGDNAEVVEMRFVDDKEAVG
ncbi:hypothetical protein [Bdellovibrio sp. HCB209]|uniref:hypothetical protein n=1 Tax=Bdellovibrio sp. HCB209 TaxID=3394354 RepID=UPI0039B69306